MRQAIDNFTLDKQAAPQSLEDLVDAHYLREIPMDPVSQEKDWVLHFGDTVLTRSKRHRCRRRALRIRGRTDRMATAYNTW